MKISSQCNKKNLTNANAQKIKKALRELIDAYQKQLEYIQSQTNEIRNLVEERQFRIAWQTVNEVSKSKIASRTKLKATSQEERIRMRKEHFKNLVGKSPKVTDKPIR